MVSRAGPVVNWWAVGGGWWWLVVVGAVQGAVQGRPAGPLGGRCRVVRSPGECRVVRSVPAYPVGPTTSNGCGSPVGAVSGEQTALLQLQGFGEGEGSFPELELSTAGLP